MKNTKFMKDLSYQTIFERTFLLEKLPENLIRSSEHLQVFDNYIENTRLRLRKTRKPQTNEFTYILEQKFAVDENDLSVWQRSRIFLNEKEHQTLKEFEGDEVTKNRLTDANEIRFNRYFYNYQSKSIKIDIYLGKEISGLILGRISFDTFGEMQDFEMPVFSTFEVTQNPFFVGQNLIGKTLENVRDKVSKMISQNEEANED